MARDDQGNIYGVRYKAVNALLLNEFLKARRKLEDQQATIAEQQKKAHRCLQRAGGTNSKGERTAPQRVSPVADSKRGNLHRKSSSTIRKVVAVHRTADAIEVNRCYQKTDAITNVWGARIARV